jgi:hypothetical protein
VRLPPGDSRAGSAGRRDNEREGAEESVGGNVEHSQVLNGSPSSRNVDSGGFDVLPDARMNGTVATTFELPRPRAGAAFP